MYIFFAIAFESPCFCLDNIKCYNKEHFSAQHSSMCSKQYIIIINTGIASRFALTKILHKMSMCQSALGSVHSLKNRSPRENGALKRKNNSSLVKNLHMVSTFQSEWVILRKL